MYVHQSVERRSKEFFEELRRHVYVTPTSYLELLNTYITLLGEKRAELEQLRGRLENGLDKLRTTGEEVEILKADLKRLQPVLEKTAKEADDMMIVISHDKKDADVTKAEVKNVELAQ